jgi:hypothetical protein
MQITVLYAIDAHGYGLRLFNIILDQALFKLLVYSFPIFWLWAHLVKVIPEPLHAH